MFYGIVTFADHLVSTDFYDDTLACKKCYKQLRSVNAPFVLYRKDGCNLTNIQFFGDWTDIQIFVDLCDVPLPLRAKMCESVLFAQHCAARCGNECMIKIWHKNGLYCLCTDSGEDNFGCQMINYRFYYQDEQITI